ncbi:hypothetical protein HKD37_11G031993 [Glycine soja]
MQSYPPRALDRRLQEDWARDAREGPKVLMSLGGSIIGISFLSSFSIPLSFIFQEAKESIDEEDPRPTSSNGAYITETTVESTVFMVAKFLSRVVVNWFKARGTDVAPCGACRPWIFFINGSLCFLEDEWQQNGEGRERRDATSRRR